MFGPVLAEHCTGFMFLRAMWLGQALLKGGEYRSIPSASFPCCLPENTALPGMHERELPAKLLTCRIGVDWRQGRSCRAPGRVVGALRHKGTRRRWRGMGFQLVSNRAKWKQNCEKPPTQSPLHQQGLLLLQPPVRVCRLNHKPTVCGGSMLQLLESANLNGAHDSAPRSPYFTPC